jgi:hypothetical protein
MKPHKPIPIHGEILFILNSLSLRNGYWWFSIWIFVWKDLGPPHWHLHERVHKDLLWHLQTPCNIRRKLRYYSKKCFHNLSGTNVHNSNTTSQVWCFLRKLQLTLPIIHHKRNSSKFKEGKLVGSTSTITTLTRHNSTSIAWNVLQEKPKVRMKPSKRLMPLQPIEQKFYWPDFWSDQYNCNLGRTYRESIM